MILSIDVGGSKVLVATFDDNGEIQKSEKFKTPIMYPDFIEELKKTIQNLTADQQPSACAIALPGVLDRDNGVALYFGNLPWENVHIRNDLQDAIHCPLYIENDAKLAALAEAEEIRDIYKRVLYVTVSTGIGLGLVQDGQIDYSVT
ncbi:ROK family protein, partial [Candidatus Saccharibacteria bacterium]|nr:ROK family protein [Candidatus Saccharibacteria bacterium]